MLGPNLLKLQIPYVESFVENFLSFWHDFMIGNVRDHFEPHLGVPRFYC